MTGDLVADRHAGTRHEVEDARRQVGVHDAFGQADGAERRVAGRVPDDRVAAGEGRGKQLGGHRVGPVPGRDDADDAARHALHQDALLGIHRGRHEAVQAGGVGGGHAPVGDQLVDLVVRLGAEGLALVLGEGAGEVLPSPRDHVADAGEGRGPVEGRCWRPSRAPPPPRPRPLAGHPRDRPGPRRRGGCRAPDRRPRTTRRMRPAPSDRRCAGTSPRS